MGATGLSTYDVTSSAFSPHRPGLEDFNGAAKSDDVEDEPDPQTDPNAEEWNEMERCIVSLGQVSDVARVGVTADATPSIAWYTTAATDITANPFTLTRTSAGRYSLTWAAGLFPMAGWPRVHLHADPGAHNLTATAIVNASPPGGQNGVLIYTNQDGAGADINFSVDLF